MFIILATDGQSYKASTIINYESGVVMTRNLPRVIYYRRGFIRLATDC